MDKSLLRWIIRNILSETYSGGIYTYGPNKFPYFTDDKKPSELDVEFDKEFDFMHDEMGEIDQEDVKDDKVKKDLNIPYKH